MKLIRAGATACVLGLGAVLFAQPSCANTVTLSPVKDNTLYQNPAGAFSNGIGEFLFVGANVEGQLRRALLQFDLSGIPASSTINGVELVMHMSRTSAGPVMIGLHPVLKAWGEGNSNATSGGGGGGAPAEPGDATWLHTFYPTVASQWAQPGGDFVAATSASALVNDVGAYTWASTGLVADVQAWMTNPSSNFGWAMTGGETSSGTAKRFDSSENASVANRPQLTVDFTPVPLPPAFLLLVTALGSLLTWFRKRPER